MDLPIRCIGSTTYEGHRYHHYQIDLPAHPAHEAGVCVLDDAEVWPEVRRTLRAFEESPGCCPHCCSKLTVGGALYSCVRCGWAWTRPQELTEVAA